MVALRLAIYIFCVINYLLTDGKEPILHIWVIIGLVNGLVTVLYEAWEIYTLYKFMKYHGLDIIAKRNVQIEIKKQETIKRQRSFAKHCPDVLEEELEGKKVGDHTDDET